MGYMVRAPTQSCILQRSRRIYPAAFSFSNTNLCKAAKAAESEDIIWHFLIRQ